LAGTALAVVALAVLTLALVRVDVALPSAVLLYLAVVVVVAVIGGIWPALAAAVAADLLVNFYFVPPYHTFSVQGRDHVITLLVFVAVAVTVSVVVEVAARRRSAALRSSIEAAVLARVSTAPLGQGSATTVLRQVVDTFGMTGAALIESDGSGAERVVAHVGQAPSANPALSMSAGGGRRLVAEGPAVFAPDQRLLAQLAAAAGRALEAERLAAQAAGAQELAETDRLRAALLAAVGHDLRTPLAAIKAASSSLTEPDLDLSPAQRTELIATIDESADQMGALVENLLAMSRLQAGALSVQLRPVALDEVVAGALSHTPGVRVDVEVPDDLPLAYADPGLLERVVANLVSNAVLVSDTTEIRGRVADGGLELAVVDHGPGIPIQERENVFAPFQRLNDHSSAGLGLGLAIVRGFTEAMDGSVTLTDTPGGGLTVVVSVRAAP
jgi:two-component system sensor histidine kinase KdpD